MSVLFSKMCLLVIFITNDKVPFVSSFDTMAHRLMIFIINSKFNFN